MKTKKITVIMAHEFEQRECASNEQIADRVKTVLLKGSNPLREKIVSVVVEDV